MDIKIAGNKWRYSFSYDNGLPQSAVNGKQKYGEVLDYDDETLEDLEVIAEKKKERIIKTL